MIWIPLGAFVVLAVGGLFYHAYSIYLEAESARIIAVGALAKSREDAAMEQSRLREESVRERVELQSRLEAERDGLRAQLTTGSDVLQSGISWGPS